MISEMALVTAAATAQYGHRLTGVRVLVERFQAGDQHAFADLYRLYQPRVYGFLLSRVRDPYLAEDLTADTFAKVLVALPQLQVRGDNLDGWMTTAAKSVTADHFRQVSARPVSPVPSPGLGLADERTAEAAPEATAIGRTWLAAAIGQLEPRQREIVVRRILLDRSVRQTAIELGCHESAVKHGLRRALRNLAGLLPAEVAVA